MKLKKLTEGNIDLGPDFNNPIFDKSNIAKIDKRKIDIKRLIERAKDALRKAKSKNDEAGIKEMEDLISDLSAWLETSAAESKTIIGKELEDNQDKTNQKGNENKDADNNNNNNNKNTGSETNDEANKDETEEKESEPKTEKESESDKEATEIEDQKAEEESKDKSDNKTENELENNDKTDDVSKLDDKFNNTNTNTDSEQNDKKQDQNSSDNKEDNNEETDNESEPAENNAKSNSNNNISNNSNSDESNNSKPADEGDSDNDDNVDNRTPGQPNIKDKKILVDPFSNKRADSTKLPPMIQNALRQGKLEIEDDWDAFKRIVGNLKGEDLIGAKNAIRDFVAADGWTLDECLVGKTLKEAIEDLKLIEAWKPTKNLFDISDSEYFNEIDNILDTIQKVDKELKRATEKDIEIGIKDITNDYKRAASEMNAEDTANVRADRQQAKARDNEASDNDFRVSNSLPGMSSFKSKLLRGIADQISTDDDDEETYAALNKRNDDDPDVLLKGVRLDDKNISIPIIDIYLDCSGSWYDKDLQKALDILAALGKWEQQKLIKVNVFYFDNHVFADRYSARSEHGGTQAWMPILENIKATKAKNVVIVTDDDMNHLARSTSGCMYVKGYVHYIWKYTKAPELPKHLRGRIATCEYNLMKD